MPMMQPKNLAKPRGKSEIIFSRLRAKADLIISQVVRSANIQEAHHRFHDALYRVQY